MFSLQQTKKILSEEQIDIPYQTIYSWARFGVLIDGKPSKIATQIGNRWMVFPSSLMEIIDAIRHHKRVQRTPAPKTNGTAKK